MTLASEVLASDSHILAVADWDEQNQTYRVYNGSGDDFTIQHSTLGRTYSTSWNANGILILSNAQTLWMP